MQISMRCGDHANVDVRSVAGPRAVARIVFLQQLQQALLRFQRQRADLVEKQRAFVGGIDQPAAIDPCRPDRRTIPFL
jgi:hypothetical protein